MVLENALVEEIKRFAAQDFQGEVFIVNQGRLIHPRSETQSSVLLSKTDQKAADTVVRQLMSAMKDERGVHAECVIALLAGLIGHDRLISYHSNWSSANINFKAIFIEDVSQDILEIVQFWEFLYTQRELAIPVPAAQIPANIQLCDDVITAIPIAYTDICFDLSNALVVEDKRRWVLAFALLNLLEMTQKVLPSPVGIRIALRCMVRAAKTPTAHLAGVAKL